MNSGMEMTSHGLLRFLIDRKEKQEALNSILTPKNHLILRLEV